MPRIFTVALDDSTARGLETFAMNMDVDVTPEQVIAEMILACLAIAFRDLPEDDDRFGDFSEWGEANHLPIDAALRGMASAMLSANDPPAPAE